MDRYKLTRNISITGISANIILFAAKLTAGIFSRSQAMIADGFNSAGDIFASLMTFLGNKIASKPEDENHPYGHGKAEYIFSMIISLSIILVAVKVFIDSFKSILNSEQFVFSWWLIITAIATIIIKAFLFIYTNMAGKEEDNLLIIANSEDHRNDIFVTSATLIGIISGQFGFYWLDGAVGIGISLWITFTGIRIFKSSFSVLMDTNMDAELQEDIIKTVQSIQGIDHLDSVAAKPVGVRYFIIVKVSVSGNMTVNDSHSIAGQLRGKIREMKKVHDVVVHINPV